MNYTAVLLGVGPLVCLVGLAVLGQQGAYGVPQFIRDHVGRYGGDGYPAGAVVVRGL